MNRRSFFKALGAVAALIGCQKPIAEAIASVDPASTNSLVVRGEPPNQGEERWACINGINIGTKIRFWLMQPIILRLGDRISWESDEDGVLILKINENHVISFTRPPNSAGDEICEISGVTINEYGQERPFSFCEIVS